jgi:hypothetical protein
MCAWQPPCSHLQHQQLKPQHALLTAARSCSSMERLMRLIQTAVPMKMPVMQQLQN